MSNPYSSGSPGVPESSMPTGASGLMPRRSSYASVVSGAAPTLSNQYQQPTRSGALSHLLHQRPDFTYDSGFQDISSHSPFESQRYDMGFNTNGQHHGRSGSWNRGGQLSGFSRAYGSLATGQGTGVFGTGHTDHFFVPSYLKGSRYIEVVEEAHKVKVLAQKETSSAAGSQTGSLSTSASSINLHSKMAPSHRGMTYDVIEKAPPAEEEALAPLPTKWNDQDKQGGLEVLSDGLEVKFTGVKPSSDRDHEACAIRADHTMPSRSGIYYFEVTIISRKREETSIGIGFSSKSVPLSRLPGWEPESWAYHGDDGNSFCCQSSGRGYGPPFTAGDIIGCGVNFRTGSAFFTKNGEHLGIAFREIKGKLFPSVGMKKPGEHIRVNFGQSPFVFDIDGMMMASIFQYLIFSLPNVSTMPLERLRTREGTGNLQVIQRIMAEYAQHPEASIKVILDIAARDGLLVFEVFVARGYATQADYFAQEEKKRVRQQIEATSTTKLAPPLNETELIQSLVLQFLTHDGYVETAKVFAEEVRSEKQALSMDRNAVIQGFDVKEDEDAGHRQRIRAAILEGDVERALQLTNELYPNVLKDNEQVYFRLRIRRFIEMIRQAAEMQQQSNSNITKKANGHSGDWYDDIINHDMELDDHPHQNNTFDRMDTEESSGMQVEYQKLLQETLDYGRELQAEFVDDPRREVSKALQDAFSLMAYQDPLNVKEVSHLLHPSGRVAVAEELNSAILLSLGKSSTAALEQLIQQTNVLLEEIWEEGQPGSFVNINDFIRPSQSE